MQGEFCLSVCSSIHPRSGLFTYHQGVLFWGRDSWPNVDAVVVAIILNLLLLLLVSFVNVVVIVVLLNHTKKAK